MRLPRPSKAGRRALYLSGFATAGLIFLLALPSPLFDAPYSPVLYDRGGALLGAAVAEDGQWRFPSRGPVNPKFAEALIAYEDRRFRFHPGVDPFAIARAAAQNLRSGKTVSGGSTITMQTIRLMRGGRKRTLTEKGIEAFLALRLELGRSKNRILELYAANAPFGGNVVGLEAASWRWFGRASDDLSWAEAAALAVLPNGPGLVHPGRNRGELKRKRDALLAELFRRGKLDSDGYSLATAEPLPAEPLPLPRLAPHLFDRAVREQGKQRIDSTLDIGLQKRTAAILERWARRFEGNGIMNAACLILDTRSGEALAYVGNVAGPGTDADRYGRAVDIIAAPRSSGSLLKPFLYASMLDSGELLPTELVSDIPTRIGSYGPENNTRTYLGAVPADQALARSLNIPAVRALRAFGIERFAVQLRTLGLTTLFRPGEDYGLPLILGGAETTLWDITGVYAGLARTVTTTDDRSSFHPPTYAKDAAARGAIPANAAPISPGAAWLTLEALTFVARPGEEAAWQDYASARRIAWKTGTSFGFRDAWAVGTTPRYTVGVWVGNASGEGRAELRGATTAAPLLFEVFSSLESSAWFPKPESRLRRVEVCADSGLPVGPNCPESTYIEAPASAPPRAACPYCRTVALNQDRSRRLTLRPGSSEAVVLEKRFVLPPAEERFYRLWNLDYRPLPPAAPAAGATLGDENGGSAAPIVADAPTFVLAVIAPEEGSSAYIPIELDGRPGRMVFQAAHRDPAAILYWHLDDRYLGSTIQFHEMEARPAPGAHVMTLVDGAGNRAERRFFILNEND